MSEKKPTHIQRIFRNIRGLSLVEIQKMTGHGVATNSLNEKSKKNPSTKIVLSMAKVLEIKPDVLLYSFGYIPETERNIIKEDPFYYMEKIQKICYNHEYRYKDEVDLNKLNNLRAFEYIHEKDKKKSED